MCALVTLRPCLTPPAPPPEREVCVLRELRSVSAREGDGATFECTVSEAETPGRWELGGRVLRPGDRVRIRQEGLAAFLPSVTRCYLARGSGTLRPIRISSASSSGRPRPSAPLPGSPGLSSATSSESYLAPFASSLQFHAPTLRNPPGTCSGTTFVLESSREAAEASLPSPPPQGRNTFWC